MQKKKTLNARIDLLPYGKTSTVSKSHQPQHQHMQQYQQPNHHQSQHLQLRAAAVLPTMNASHCTNTTSTPAAVSGSGSTAATVVAAASTNAAVNFNLPLISKHQLYKSNIENSDNGEQTNKLQLIDYDEI